MGAATFSMLSRTFFLSIGDLRFATAGTAVPAVPLGRDVGSAGTMRTLFQRLSSKRESRIYHRLLLFFDTNLTSSCENVVHGKNISGIIIYH